MSRVLIAGLPDRLAAWMARRMDRVLVEVAWNADAAYDLLQRERWSLLVVDAGSDAHGVEVLLRLVREEPRLRGLPVILTVNEFGEGGVSETKLEQWVRGFGIDRILLAPVDRGELARAAEELLRREALTPSPVAEAAPSASHAAPAPPPPAAPGEPPAPAAAAASGPPAPSATSAGAGSEAPSPRAAPPALAAGLASVWRRGRPTVDARLATLDAAIAACASGSLTGEGREEAEREAHRLAGALGTFGSDEGSRLARAFEEALGAAYDAGAVAGMGGTLASLRAAIASLDAALGGEPAPEPAKAATPGTGVRVLVVDDDAAFVEALRTEGAARGVAVEGAAPAEALARADAAPPNAVIMDLSGSDEEGEAWFLLSQLARKLPSVPVLVVAGRGSLLDRVRILQLGGRMFLQKPLPAGEVLDAVARQLPRADATGRRVLAVDDDPAILQAVRTLLQPQGYDVHTLDSPLRFWGTLSSVKPELLVLDVDMPFLNGIELCRVVRADHRYSELPVLFLTARTDAETILRVFAAGADDYVTKPVLGPELSARVRNRLERTPRAG